VKLTIKAETIKALLAVAAKSDVRYYLNAIAIDARATGDVTLVATDGHRLLAVPVDSDDIENFADFMPGVWVVDRALLESVKPMKAGRTDFPLALTIASAGTGNLPTVSLVGATTASGTAVDGRFPDWRRVMPASANGIAAQFSPEYVGSFGKVGELLGGKGKSIPCVIHHNGSDGALVTFPGSPAIGVIMPMRVSADTSTPPHPGLPSWALAATSPAVKVAA